MPHALPTWLVIPGANDQPWHKFPKKLIDEWSFFIDDLGEKSLQKCAMPGCPELTCVTIMRGGWNGSADPTKPPRPTCSLAHSLMIAAGEAG